MDHPIIQLHDIHKSFGANEVVKGIELSMQQNWSLYWMGLSGCNKTANIRLTAGFKDLAKGSVFIADPAFESGFFMTTCQSAEGTPGSFAMEEGTCVCSPGEAMPGDTRGFRVSRGSAEARGSCCGPSRRRQILHI